MPTFKQKNVIKSYKLRLQEKLKTITEETDNASSFLNNCVLEFRNRVQHILEIKDEKCLSLYRKLIRDLESYSEKLFILQASIEEVTEEESDSSEDEDVEVALPKRQSKTCQNVLPQTESLLAAQSCQNVVSQTESVPTVSSHQNSLPQTENVLTVQSCQNGLPQTESVMTVQSCFEDDLNSKFSGLHINDEGSITEDDFCSLQSFNIQNTNSTSLNSQLDGYHIELAADGKNELNINASQSSCYCSISSNISESFAFHVDNRSVQSVGNYPHESKNNLLELSKANSTIHPADLEISSSFSATLSYIIDPGNFWVQLENSNGITFPKSESDNFNKLSFIENGSYCLAPFKSSSFFYRAQSLCDAKSANEIVKVLFIDHGSSQDVLLGDLRSLPTSAYSVPAQAVHCYLYGIVPNQDSWSNESIERLKEFQNCCIETFVKSKENLYGVELVVKLAADLDEDFSVDIGQALYLDGLAVLINESPGQNVSLNQESQCQLSKPKVDSSSEVSGSYDINALSSDSGVSVSSGKSSQVDEIKHSLFKRVSSDYIAPTAVMISSISPLDDNLIGFTPNAQNDLISFDSLDALEELQNSCKDLKLSDRSFTSSCLTCKNKDFCFHLKIPSPSLSFVEEDMVIVMISHIVDPSEFYVNMAVENVVTLDDLREQMTALYSSQQNCHQVNIEDLYENMFCAGRFVGDKYWYRIKILRISPEDKEKNQVFVQYIDYGNFAVINCSDIQALTQQFSQHPCFAIKCSLAGVTPVCGESWSDAAVNMFKKLTSFDRCLTAQICNGLCPVQMDAYCVLLWDTEDSEDLLINSSLAEQKVALFDNTLLYPSVVDETALKPCSDLDTWNPMVEEYYQTENSYAVNDEALEVVTTGYQAKDEEYTCKYFSLRGHCPRGENCQYEHLPLLESGVTRDQEEVYCLDSLPIISEDINNILVQVSAIVTPGHFYVILPYGCKTVDEIDNLVYHGSPYYEIINSEANALFDAINKHYSKAPFQENTTIALSCGTIVVAKRRWDGKWHRGRVVDVVGINEPAKVFFVDCGDQEWVPRKFIRTILPQFLHTPFQAIQCRLREIDPIGFADGLSWSSEAVNVFKDMVDGKILLAEIVQRYGQIFHVSLRRTSQHDHQNIGQVLVSAGYAEINKVIPLNKKEICYVPG